MNELVQIVAQKTGLTPEQAQAAVTAVIDHLKTRLPAPIAAHLDTVMSGGTAGLEQEAESFIAGKLGGLFGGSKTE